MCWGCITASMHPCLACPARGRANTPGAMLPLLVLLLVEVVELWGLAWEWGKAGEWGGGSIGSWGAAAGHASTTSAFKACIQRIDMLLQMTEGWMGFRR